MPVLGTCRAADKIGLDTVLEKLQSLHGTTGEHRFEPVDYLVEHVEAGHTGEDAGKGLYDYTGEWPYQFIDQILSDEGVLELEFTRTERLNTFSEEMFTELGRAIEEADPDEVSCVVLSGAGDRAFSAGADLTGFLTNRPTDFIDAEESIERLAAFERPTIAKIDGFCLGGGFEVALACDIRVATKSSSFGSPEIDLGLIPGGGGTQRLVRLLGPPRTKELVFTGKHISAKQAADWDIINRAVPDDALDETVGEFVTSLTDGPKTALKVAKRVIDEGSDISLDAGIALEGQGFGLQTTTDDVLEGVQAFRQDRDPQFED